VGVICYNWLDKKRHRTDALKINRNLEELTMGQHNAKAFRRKGTGGECLLCHPIIEAKSGTVEREHTVNAWEASTLPTELHPQS
jgi:hypothetical protein